MFLIGKWRISGELQRLFRGSAIYAAVNILYKATPLAVLPLVARRLSVEDVGILGLFTAFVTLLIPVIACGTHGYISVQFSKRPEAEMASLVGTLFVICLAAAILAAFFGTAFSDVLMELTGMPWKHIGLMLLTSVAHSCLEILLVLYQMRQRPAVYGAIRMTMMLFEAGGVILLVLIFDWGLDGALLSLTMPPLLALTAMVLLRHTHISFSAVTGHGLRAALKFGLPIIGYQLGFLVVVTADRLMVANLLGLRDAGIFVVGVQFGMAIALLNGAINKAWVPWLFPQLVGPSRKGRARIVRFEYWYFAFLIFSALCWSIVGSLILGLLFTDEYSAAASVVWIISFGHALAGMYKAKSAYLFFTETTFVLLFLAAVVASLNVAMNFLLIPTVGISGAATATLISYLLAFVASWWLGHRAYPMPVRVRLLRDVD